MPAIKILLWVLVVVSSLGLLQGLFYQVSLACWNRLFDSQLVRDACQQNPLFAAYRETSRSFAGNTAWRIFSLVASAILLSGAIIGLIVI